MLKHYLKLKLKLEQLVKREDGATAIEYAIIAGLIAVAIIAAAKLLGVEISDTFKKITDALRGN